MWRPSATGPYARIGKFFAPYGLRFVEHIFFVQRYTGFDIYNETYNVYRAATSPRTGSCT